MAKKKAPAGTQKKAAEKKPASVLRGQLPTYAGAAVIAQLLGFSVRRVQQLTQEGILETSVPPEGGARKYNIRETVQKYIEYTEKKTKESGSGNRYAELMIRKLEAEAELKESQGQLHRLKTAIAEGKYISAEQAGGELSDFMAGFKKFALNIPPRVAGTLAGYADDVTVRSIEKSLRRELETMLKAFADAALPEEGGQI